MVRIKIDLAYAVGSRGLHLENHGRPWPCEREGPTKWEGFSFPLLSSGTSLHPLFCFPAERRKLAFVSEDGEQKGGICVSRLRFCFGR